jgi:hypothetical protein
MNTAYDVEVVDDLDERDYHRHPALSNSLAKLMLPPNCPAMYPYRRAHPDDTSDVFDFGRAAHALVLGVGAPVVAVPDELLASNGALSTKAAKEFVEQARADGATPLKAVDIARLEAMVAKLREHPIAGPLLTREDFRHELSVFWQDVAFDVHRRARLDLYPDTPLAAAIVVDYKTAESAEPRAFARKAATYGYHLQDAYYSDAVEAVTGERPRFVFVVQEKEPPFLVSVVQLDENARDLGRRRVAEALELFAWCQERDEWPGFDGVEVVDLPPWSYR